MAKKQELKLSEARVLILLDGANEQVKYTQGISTKLDIGYNYLLQIIDGLLKKGWVRKYHMKRKTFWSLSTKGKDMVELAKETITTSKR